MKTRHLLIPFVLGLGLTLALVWLLGGQPVLATVAPTPGGAGAPAERPLHDATPIHYVATTGTDSGDCSTPGSACLTVQYAVDRAGEGDEIRIAAGTYTDISVRPRNDFTTTGVVTQVVYISKTVAIQGGYTTTNWTTPYPLTQPTTLDAQGQGRVIYITGDISPTVEGLRITGGDAQGMGGYLLTQDPGGGVYVITATAIIRDNQVFSNTAPWWGGGLYLNHSDATLSENTITCNTTAGGGGVGLYRSDATIRENTITANTANSGGGLYLRQSDNTTLSRNTLTANMAYYYGGGLYLEYCDAVFNGNIIISNTADYGGGLSMYESDAVFNGNIVISNTADYGGGLRLYESDATLTNTVIANNQANTAGSGLYVLASSPRLLHTTIARNSGGDGSGVYVTQAWGTYSAAAFTNTILVSHTVGITVTAGNTTTLESTLWGSGDWANGTDWGGAGTIFTSTQNYQGDPAFAADGYHLTDGSAAIDRGVDAGADVDVDGEPRQGAPDLGADEYVWHIYLPLVTRQYQ